MAHRGGAGLAPENTMLAFRQAVELWEADILETDVRLTRDGRLVVIHDETVDRTCDGAGAVRDLPWGELRGLDAGARFLDPQGRASAVGKGVRIPLLDELLETFPRTRINVEPKTPDAARVAVETVVRHGAQHRVLLGADREGCRAARHGYPGPVSASRRQVALFYYLHPALPPSLYLPATDAFQVPDRWEGRQVVTPRFVRAAHERNIPVHVWTVDHPEDMRRLLGWGVDGIQTDRPDRLARVLVEETGRPVPPGLRPEEGRPADGSGRAGRGEGDGGARARA